MIAEFLGRTILQESMDIVVGLLTPNPLVPSSPAKTQLDLPGNTELDPEVQAW